MYSYFGLLLLFGALKKRSVEIYEIWSIGNDWASCAMSRYKNL